ncbi:MAG: hypothetical protein ACUVQY_10300 [Thermoproteota archaeon]
MSVALMVKRKMLAVDEVLAKRVLEVARERGQTLFGFVNDVLEQAVRAHSLGFTIKQVLDERELMVAARDSGFVHAVKTLLFDAVERAYASGDKRSLLEKWRETGRWYGKYFMAKSSENAMAGFRDFVCSLMWGASEFNIRVNEDYGEIRCVSADFPASYTELLSVFLEGALETLNYRCVEKDVFKGLIRIVFKKREDANA